MAILALIVAFALGSLVTAMVLAFVNRSKPKSLDDYNEAYHHGYQDGYDNGRQLALDEIKERHKARGRKAAATRRKADP